MNHYEGCRLGFLRRRIANASGAFFERRNRAQDIAWKRHGFPEIVD
jgi:hypothetical protein